MGSPEHTADKLILPADYKALSAKGKKAKGEKGKGGTKKRPAAAKRKKKATKPTKDKKTEDGPEADDPVKKYLDWDGVNPSKAKILNRVHSNVWHKTLKTHVDAGMDVKAAKERAAKDASAAKERFLRFMNMAG